MKKLISLIIVASLAFTIQAQDITNTLGTDGKFYVNKEGGTPNYLTLNSDGDHILQVSSSTSAFTINNASGEAAFKFDDQFNVSDIAMIKIGHADENWIGGQFAHLQLQSAATANKFNLVSRGTNNSINGYYARGDASGATNVTDADILLTMNAYGYHNSGHSKAAYIEFVVDGAPSSSVPGKIDFATNSTGGTSAVHMSIKNDGTVNIAKVLDVDGAVNMGLDSGGSTTLNNMHYTYSTQNGATVTLPTAIGIAGRVYIIKLQTTGSATVATTSSQNIDGATTYSLSAEWKYVKVQSNGAAWLIIGQN